MERKYYAEDVAESIEDKYTDSEIGSLIIDYLKVYEVEDKTLEVIMGIFTDIDAPCYIKEDGKSFREIETETQGTCYCQAKFDCDSLNGDVIDVYDDAFEFIGSLEGYMGNYNNTALRKYIDEYL